MTPRRVEVAVVGGGPAGAIAAWLLAASGHEVLILERSSGLTGTTTAAVAAHAPCDVVVVPSFWTADHVRGRVVVGVKSRANLHELLSQAFAEAASRHAELIVVTAWEVADPYFDRIEFRTHAEEWERNGTDLVLEAAADWRTAYPDVPLDVITMNSRVTYVDETAGVRTTVRLVYPQEAAGQGHLPVSSPLGTALLGLRERQQIEAHFPLGGRRRLRVCERRRLPPNRAGTTG